MLESETIIIDILTLTFIQLPDIGNIFSQCESLSLKIKHWENQKKSVLTDWWNTDGVNGIS